MVETATEANLPWHFFLDDKSDGGARAHIERWRKVGWRNLLRDLRSDYAIELSDDLEPHWVEPNYAIFWAKDTTISMTPSESTGSRKVVVIEEDVSAWKPTARAPVGSASQLAYYINRKGFRLRPPVDGLVPELRAVVESAVPPENPATEMYKCEKHGSAYPTWKGYRLHCNHFNERLTAEPPESVTLLMAGAEYYCLEHNFTSDTRRVADAHAKQHAGKHVSKGHITSTQMKRRTGINKEKVS